MKLRWRFGLIAGIFLAIFCLYPQFKMLYLRGGEWNGHYAYNDIDEVAYASYVRALIDGRPRKNDPYSGRDDTPETPQPESLFSIQFAAPYTIAIPARLLGIGTPWAMTIAGAFAGLLAALAAFWFLGKFTGDSWYAMTASLAIFALGALAAGEGALPEILFDGFSYPYFPGFRRYIPALAMPAFLALVGSLWMFISSRPNADETDGSDRDRSGRGLWRLTESRLFYGIIASACFAYCVYSYFYIWTTAAAFLGCVVLVWLIERPEGVRRDIKALLMLGTVWAVILLPYFYLLSGRADSMDHVQLLVYTRMPDLNRVPMWISILSLFILIGGMLRKVFTVREPAVLFTIAIALVPFAVFNQQVVTGRSLQPIHYQVFIGNYVAVLGLVAAVGLVWRRRLGLGRTGPKMICAAALLVVAFWGFVECHYTVRVLDEANVARDVALPLARRLETMAEGRPDPHRITVLSYDWLIADDLPSVAPQNILWARHQHVFAGLTWEESKERYFRQLYFQNVDEDGLDYLLKRDFVTQIALFGWGRHTDRLSVDAKPLTYGEIAGEVEKYRLYRANFSKEQAAEPLIQFVIVPNDGKTDTSVLESWYQLDEGEVVGDHLLFKARLK
ncbi:MAG: hypothetical protein AB7V18_14045 [Pyrinomonadaceae bacterium]